MPADLGPVLAVAVGSGFVCAITQAKAVRCWLTDGLTGLSGLPFTAQLPVPPSDLGPVEPLLSAGINSVCVLLAGGTGVRCWSSALPAYDTTYTSPKPLSTLQKTSISAEPNLFVVEAGNGNITAPLFNDEFRYMNPPARVGPVSTLSFKAISCAWVGPLCAIKASDQPSNVACWGDNVNLSWRNGAPADLGVATTLSEGVATSHMCAIVEPCRAGETRDPSTGACKGRWREDVHCARVRKHT